jgi:hypothetical protein
LHHHYERIAAYQVVGIPSAQNLVALVSIHFITLLAILDTFRGEI